MLSVVSDLIKTIPVILYNVWWWFVSYPVVEWKLPSQLVFCTDRLLREVMPSGDLQQHLGLSYLHEEMMVSLNPSLVENLGIQKLKCHHLMEVAKGITLSLSQDDMIGKLWELLCF